MPTTLSYSSRVSLSPAVLLKLLVLEEEREMFDLPFSFSLINGLGREAKQNEGHVDVTPAMTAGTEPPAHPRGNAAAVGTNLAGCFYNYCQEHGMK